MASAKLELQNNLVLNSYFCSLFGKDDFGELRSLLKSEGQGVEIKEGFDEEGTSYIFNVLQSQADLNISKEQFEEYDRNIKHYVDHINENREEPIKLKYFQYFSVLFTEIFLDKYFQDPIQFLNEINDYIYQTSKEKNWSAEDWVFSRDDLEKIAFWMATGSGKTLIFHINYLQFKRYNKGEHNIDFDNILLITPSSYLTDQHISEMNSSNIPCDYFYDITQGYFTASENDDKVKVIEIHKLIEDKEDEGIRVDIDELGGKNIVFVDEGHKGSHGDTWKYIRGEIARNGFSFEYSATFGQVTSSGKKSPLLFEYGKSILFDYSYKFFHQDGYGKDYRIINLKNDSFDNSTRYRLMLANLLSFFEQKKVFRKYEEQYKEYNIKNPLWVFVGSKVQKGKVRTQTRSDILQIVKFMDKFLTDKEWAVEVIRDILEGKSGLIDKKNRDLFGPSYPEKKLKFIKDGDISPKKIYNEILKMIFHTNEQKPLYLADLNVEGEIALRAGDSRYFGLINIGDDRKFSELVKDDKETDVQVEDERVRGSIFSKIEEDPGMNVLIGAKKFIEGWDSYRVANMGLLHVGKTEGTQVIQLFGRGVRLKGKNNSLKRSEEINEEHPPFIELLETLNIFGLEANYMDLFKKHLENEDIETNNYLSLDPVPIDVEKEYLKEDLLIPKVKTERFSKKTFVELQIDDEISFKIDLRPKAETITSKEESALKAQQKEESREIDETLLDLLDWDEIYFRLLKYRKEREWNNIVFDKDSLKDIIKRGNYELYCSKEWMEISQFSEVEKIREIVIKVLKKYLKKFYKQKKHTWAKKHMDVVKLTNEHDNISFKEYTIKIKDTERDILEKVSDLFSSRLKELYDDFEGEALKNVYFDRHIYQPLLAKREKVKTERSEQSKVKIKPPGLNIGEENFVEDLKEYFKTNNSLLNGQDIYILRNQPHRGVGFFKSSYFYPDFILWIKDSDTQYIIFVDPKGLGHMWEGLKEEKIELHSDIKEIQDKISKKVADVELILDSFIISRKGYNEVKNIFNNKSKKRLERNNILFQTDPNYIEKLLSSSLESSSS